jgi:hypothetical protein
MKTSLIVRTFLAAAAALLVMACASGGGSAPAVSTITGQHPATWLTTHWNAYELNPASCVPCHGSALDPTSGSGTSGVTCFGCHQPDGTVAHPNGPAHPAGWAASNQHGRLGAQAPYNAAYPLGMQGFASCTPCHGADYNTPIGNGAPSCFGPATGCHATPAPHGNPNWGAQANPPNPATNPDHDQTDQSNAPECFKCHAAGSANNPVLNPPNNNAPAAPGTPPGCFNNTLCHGQF